MRNRSRLPRRRPTRYSPGDPRRSRFPDPAIGHQPVLTFRANGDPGFRSWYVAAFDVAVQTQRRITVTAGLLFDELMQPFACAPFARTHRLHITSYLKLPDDVL